MNLLRRDDIYDWCDLMVAAERIRERIFNEKRPNVEVSLESTRQLRDLAFDACERVVEIDQFSYVYIRGVEFYAYNYKDGDEDDD